MPATPNLRGASIYIYNFLDFRGEMFGRRMLEQVDLQLRARLSDNGVRAERLWFADSPVSLTFSKSTGVGQSYDRIPVPETVLANRTRETDFEPQYRLVIIPANFAQEGAWQSYQIRWILSDVSSGTFLWSLITSNRRMTLWRNDEDSVRRGRALMDEVFNDMRENGLLDPVASEE